MSHAIHKTRGFILKTKNMRESNKLVYLYTRDFGLIYANLQSVRELQAKMRSHAQTLSLVDVDVVQGRDIWKITGMHEYIPSLPFVGTGWYGFFDTIALLLIRLCTGEEIHEGLWSEIEALFELKESDRDINFETLEILIVTRILYFLGYWQGNESWVYVSGYDQSFFDDISAKKPMLVQKINQSLADSQL